MNYSTGIQTIRAETLTSPKNFKTAGNTNCTVSEYNISDQADSPSPVVGNDFVQWSEATGLRVFTNLIPNENATYLIDFTATVTRMNGNSGTMPISLIINAPFDPPKGFSVPVTQNTTEEKNETSSASDAGNSTSDSANATADNSTDSNSTSDDNSTSSDSDSSTSEDSSTPSTESATPPPSS